MTLSKSFLALALSLTGFSALAHEMPLPNSGGLQEVIARDGREVIADKAGLTVYTFDPDQKDVSVCYGSCAQEWPPVLTTATEVVQAPYGTTTRKDGTLQLTFDHKPLYLFDEDKVQGDILGDGDDGIWHVIVSEDSPK